VQHETQSKEHEIQLQVFQLPNVGLYRQSLLELAEVQRQIQELLDQGIIRANASPCGAPITSVLEKDGTWHMCISLTMGHLTI